MQKLKDVKLCMNDEVGDDYPCGREYGHQGKHVSFDEGGMVTCEWYEPGIDGIIMIEFLRNNEEN